MKSTLAPPQLQSPLPPPPPKAQLAAFVWGWGLVQLGEIAFHGALLGGGTVQEWGQVALIGLAMCAPHSRVAITAALAARAWYVVCVRWPFVWDSEHLALLTDVAVAVHIWLDPRWSGGGSGRRSWSRRRRRSDRFSSRASKPKGARPPATGLASNAALAV